MHAKAAHVCLAGLSSVVAEAKGRNGDAIVHILRTLAVRILEVYAAGEMGGKTAPRPSPIYRPSLSRALTSYVLTHHCTGGRAGLLARGGDARPGHARRTGT